MRTSNADPESTVPSAAGDLRAAQAGGMRRLPTVVGLMLALVVGTAAIQGQEAAPRPPAGLEAEYARAMKLIAERVGKSRPWIKRRPILGADGGMKMGGEQITAADENGITVTVIDKQGTRTVQRPWDSLDDARMTSLLKGVVDHQSAEDCLAAGMVALTRKQMDAAEQHFARAAKLGAKTERYQAPLAEAAFAGARKLNDEGKFAEAATELDKVKEKYPSWADSHKREVADALARAESGHAEGQAGKLLARGREVAKSQHISDRWDLKLICDELKTKYGKTQAAQNNQGELARWAQAVSGLGDFLIVRKDGEGQFTTIQEAVKIARPESLIQIEDDGSYNEKVVVPKEKEGLLLRGKEGRWPVITSFGERKGIDDLVTIEAKRSTVQHVILAHSAPSAQRCLSIKAGEFKLRQAVVFMVGADGLQSNLYAQISIVDSLILAHVHIRGKATVVNSLFLGAQAFFGQPAKLERCTFVGQLASAWGGAWINCLLGSIRPVAPETPPRIQTRNCNISGQFHKSIKPGKGCFREKPSFRDPKKLDFTPAKGTRTERLGVGCRYTPEMEEMRKRVLLLSKKGIIKL